MYFRVNGHPRDSVHTYGTVTGLINFGLSLGSLTGPVVSGVITDALDFSWTLTVLAFACAFMVRFVHFYIFFAFNVKVNQTAICCLTSKLDL